MADLDVAQLISALKAEIADPLRAEIAVLRADLRRANRLALTAPDALMSPVQVARRYRRSVEYVKALILAGRLAAQERDLPSGRKGYRVHPRDASACVELTCDARQARKALRMGVGA